jgi:hypothetical protein
VFLDTLPGVPNEEEKEGEGGENTEVKHWAAQCDEVHAMRAYRHFLVFPSTFILYYNSVRHENAVRDQQTRLCARARSDVPVSPLVSLFRSVRLRVRAAGFN